MTNPTPHGQVPEALRLAEQYDHGDPAAHGNAWKAAVCTELRRLHAYCQELESQVFLDCMTHAQNPAENEHVAGDVSKNGVELNMSAQQPAPATQPASQQEPDEIRSYAAARAWVVRAAHGIKGGLHGTE